ncbi:nucleotidyl transferase AbiEii/AbiGii toxin family protein [Trinickia mobilis]|uniref:nucleotidyl transferase AbiEii/AbiGii toxin family protein n=1 Tax=Trinickia mobilis TaxID=2816356 RepID=UPI001A8D35DE
MTSILPNSSLKVGEDRPVHPVTIALLRHVSEAVRSLKSEFVAAGATARDIVLWHVHGIRAERATRDVDVAVCAVNWEAHGDLIAALEATGRFKADGRSQQSLIFDDASIGKPVPLDLVPFGPLEAPDGYIAWPPKGDFVMNVLGFREAVDTSININIGENYSVPVAALPALALLKLLAWHDRRTSKNTDAADLLLILRNCHKAGNEERIWEIGADLLDAHDFDVDLASTALLGRQARQTALPATLTAVTALLADEGTYETLRRDMLARAAAQLLDDFADGSDKTLAAFRDGFMAAPPTTAT